MKKVILLILVVGLALSLTGATCLQNVQEIACNPPPAVLASVNAAAPIIAYAITLLVKGSDEWATAVNAQAAVTALQAGVCISLKQLNGLIAFLNGETFKRAEAKVMMARWINRDQVRTVNVAPLEEWAAKFPRK